MRRLNLSDGSVLFGLTDAVPAPAAVDPPDTGADLSPRDRRKQQ